MRKPTDGKKGYQEAVLYDLDSPFLISSENLKFPLKKFAMHLRSSDLFAYPIHKKFQQQNLFIIGIKKTKMKNTTDDSLLIIR